MQPSPIVIRGRPLAGGRLPAVCAPLVAPDADALEAETAAVAALHPDLLEWRVDFFHSLGDIPAVLAAGRRVRAAAQGLPILLTRRSQREGGQAIALDESQVAALYEALAGAGLADLLDWEMSGPAPELKRIRTLASAQDLPLVLSFHDFHRTPSDAELRERFARAHALGADVAKVAVMPQSMADVHRLLGATLQASCELAIPVISMAMGELGAVSRICGGVFGSALTFAVGGSASAPGQMPIADVRAALAVLQRATSG
ncbi:MAG TPA: type I 3-dehydroquinate dehydratase [Ramlibacter sp.]|nr:type I 3-dehydroquinate dehydratase [Ramlibacter sp.]